jgi:Domain of unknown function (DUF929)
VVAAFLAAVLARSFVVGNAVAPKLTPASASVLNIVRGVTPVEQDEVGLPSSVTAPFVARGAPSLRVDGRVAALYIGAEYCPYCAALRWAMVMAFDRFGRFSGLGETTSSPWDTDPKTPTFSFYGAHYASPYLPLVTVEREGNDTSGPGTSADLQPITPQESKLWARYDARFGEPQGYPFLDVGNEVFFIGTSYDPGVLAGLDQAEVAADLARSSSPVAQDIVGLANYLTAAICQVTHGQPAPVCSVKVVRTAAQVLKLG